MQITNFRIINYKSFLDTGEIALSPHFNVVIGQNNVGKTALVEAISGKLGENPHRSTATKTKVAPPKPGSRVELSLAVGHDEVIDILAPMNNLHLPFPAEGYRARDDLLSQLFTEQIIEPNTITVRIIMPQHSQPLLASVGPFESYSTETSGSVFAYDAATQTARQVGSAANGPGATFFPAIFANIVVQRIYGFKAERYNIGQAQVGGNPMLNPDASNLPQVLNLLQTKSPGRFRRYRQDVITIFPQVRDITIPPSQNQTGPVEIFLWEIDPESEREDLATSLAHSGTGIGQVMAMLYVAINTDFSTGIVIDEPQSFLHPGAVQKLLDLLRTKYTNHQYIITTHSSTAITAGNPETILLVRKKELNSYVEPIDIAERQHLEVLLSEIGARLSDVFGADEILWVEGPTEEQCFPLIVRGILRQPLLGTTILGVIATGDFGPKQVTRTVEIYSKLSGGRELLPPAIGFIFDSEGLTEIKQIDLQRQSGGKVHFLPRKMYENYLLNPAAIAAIIADIREFESPPPTAADIQAWLNEHRWDYFSESIPQTKKDEPGFWSREVYGAKVLAEIFRLFLGEGYTYEKIEHGVSLTKWLIDNAPDDLLEVTSLLANIMPSQ